MPDINCIIVEDEPLAVKVLADYIALLPFLKLRGTFKDALLAADYLHSNPVDLMFLDIHLPRLRGMAFLRTLRQPPAVIITTAYHQYAVEGFELNVTDYLLKPFAFERFLTAVNKVKASHAAIAAVPAEQPPLPEAAAVKDHLFISVQKKKVKILFSDIVYIESQREYIKSVTTKQTWLSKMSTHEIETLLPVRYFRRIHRSYIIALEKMESFTADMVQVSGTSLPIGRAYRNVLEGL